MCELLVIDELLISHRHRTKLKLICYMAKSLIADGPLINDGLFYPIQGIFWNPLYIRQ
jgi:hypothetical protein